MEVTQYSRTPVSTGRITTAAPAMYTSTSSMSIFIAQQYYNNNTTVHKYTSTSSRSIFIAQQYYNSTPLDILKHVPHCCVQNGKDQPPKLTFTNRAAQQ